MCVSKKKLASKKIPTNNSSNNPLKNEIIENILENDFIKDITMEFNGISFPVYSEFERTYQQLFGDYKTKIRCQDYLFLIRHRKLYNGGLHKIQIANYIKNHFITRYDFDKISMTHLMCACIYSINDSNLELVKLLVNNFNFTKRDNTDHTALSYAFKNPGNIKIIGFLLNYIESNYIESDYFAIDQNIINDALIYWSKTDYLPCIEMAKLLIKTGASINYKDCTGSTILINIINNKNYYNITDLVKFLLTEGVDIYALTTICPDNNVVKEKWTTSIGSKLIESVKFEINGEQIFPSYYGDYDESCRKPKYSIMNHLIKRYCWDNNKRIISMFYDYGYRELPNTTNTSILEFTKQIVNDIEFRESYFRKFKPDLIEKQREIVYKPGSVRSEIIKLNWEINSGQTLNPNKYIFDYFGINNLIELEKMINDV
ncbi:ankyrin repeat-containing protein [Acanthamoeba polyphaga mimivirus]|uniref:Ankyrin repeat-containing protein n=1 Tax=Acanthamoeba polyphaga mimivirus TaxID=212035 RepID=A0A0G2Y1S4_MIMIV|nr:ankyrin repeat-containing protein [Acanthamoeba polyphaga mimivirus]